MYKCSRWRRVRGSLVRRVTSRRVMRVFAVLASIFAAGGGDREVRGETGCDTSEVLFLDNRVDSCSDSTTFPIDNRGGCGESCAGACCTGQNCTSQGTETECTAAGGVWHAGEDCATFTCPTFPRGEGFIEEIARVIEAATDATLGNSYELGRVKHLVYLDFGLPILDLATVTILLDLDDLAQITEEGRDGWITYWVDLSVGLSVGTNPLPIGAGFVFLKREGLIDDPLRTGEVTLWEKTIAGGTFSFLSATADGVEPGSLSWSPNTDLASVSVLKTTWNLLRGEVRRSSVVDGMHRAIPVGTSTNFAGIAALTFDSLFALDSEFSFQQRGESGLWRGFTSSDAPLPGDANHLGIVRVRAGVDVDGDGFDDNYVPPSVPLDGRPSAFYPLKVDVRADEYVQMDLNLVVSDVPSGWVIEALGDDGRPLLIFPDTYPLALANPTALLRTEWHVGSMLSSSPDVTVVFTLYKDNVFPIPNDPVDSVRVRLAHPPDCNGNQIPDYAEIQGNPSLDCNNNHALDECDITLGSRDRNLNQIPDECELLGNYDADADVDLDDVRSFVECLAGPGEIVGNQCSVGDTDGAGRVDLTDFASIQVSFTGVLSP